MDRHGGPPATSDQPTGTEAALARMAACMRAQRSELFRRVRSGGVDQMHLVGWWAAPGDHHVVLPGCGALPLDWFPWSLGNARPHRHLFVRNAAALPLRPAGHARIADLGMGSALYLPLGSSPSPVGAVCLYWTEERRDWPSTATGVAVEEALHALRAS